MTSVPNFTAVRIDNGLTRAFEIEAMLVCENNHCTRNERRLSREQALAVMAGAADWPWCCGEPMLVYCAQKEMRVSRA